MKRLLLLTLILSVTTTVLHAQEAGGSVYNRQGRKTSGVTTGNVAVIDNNTSVYSPFMEANVLLNVKADEYIAVFGLAQEGATVADSNQKLDAQLKQFIAGLESLGIKNNDIFVDFIAQNRIYDYGVAGNTATEKLSGFEIKKNVAVHYKDKALLDKLLAAASKAAVFDLIKVDYLISNMEAVRARLLEEASRVIKSKEESYSRLFSIKLKPNLVVLEKYNAFFPSEMYNVYTAYESGNVGYNDNVRVVQKRKANTFYFNPLNVSEFDAVINPVNVEPTVQCTLFLKIKYTPNP